MSIKRNLPKFIVLITLGLAMILYTSSVASGNGGCIAGGDPAAQCNVVEGSSNNSMAGEVKGGTIGGGGGLGFPNRVTKNFGTIAGGLDNRAADRATVAGGSGNIADGIRASIGGGFENTATGESSTIGGGYGNLAGGIESVVSGGLDNNASGWDAAIGGGSGNVANYHLATVAGGSYNKATSLNAAVGGGDYNEATGAYAVIAGGSGNEASGLNTAIAGGAGNDVSGAHSIIGGGLANHVTGTFSSVLGGLDNLAGTATDDHALYATVGGGAYNTAGGLASTVAGGLSNTAGGDYSFAAGRRARIDAQGVGAFLFADSSDFDFTSAAPNEFAVRATGGVRLVTAIDSSGNPSAGVRLPKGSGSWETLSDRDSKANFAMVEPSEILQTLMTIPITTWNYKTQDPSIRHIGPMAQDLRRFGLGEDDKHISTVDAEGIALAAIQGLNQVVDEQNGRIAAQQQEIDGLKSELAAQESRTSSLEARIAALEQASEPNGTAVRLDSNLSFGDGIILAGVCLAGLVLVPFGQSLSKRGIGRILKPDSSQGENS